MQSTIIAVCTSPERGTAKVAQAAAVLVRGHGLESDAHAGSWHRQVSLLAAEQLEPLLQGGAPLSPGGHGENIVTRGLDLEALEAGRRVRVGDRAVLQITERGVAFPAQRPPAGAAARGLLARVARGGRIRAGDPIATDPALDRFRYAVVTLSDRGAAGAREDTAGPLAARLLDQALGGVLVAHELRPDDRPAIEATLIQLCDEELCDLVVTTGGTGLSPRDVTPDATLAVIDRQVPGMAEAIRAAGLVKTPHAMLSRAVCGQRGQSLILNLSGSPRAVQEQLEVVIPALPHALRVATGIPQDCAR